MSTKFSHDLNLSHNRLAKMRIKSHLFDKDLRFKVCDLFELLVQRRAQGLAFFIHKFMKFFVDLLGFSIDLGEFVFVLLLELSRRRTLKVYSFYTI